MLALPALTNRVPRYLGAATSISPGQAAPCLHQLQHQPPLLAGADVGCSLKPLKDIRLAKAAVLPTGSCGWKRLLRGHSARLGQSSELQSSEFWDSSLRAIFRSLPKHPATVPAVEKALSAFGNLQLSTPAETVLEPSFQLQEEPYYNRGNSLQCVCYGIGNFSSCIKARYQLAFLLLLLQELKIPKNLCYVFDPVFSTLEIEVLNNFDLTVLLENEEGKRCVQEPTIFYMVHCGKALYNNLLWSNWSVDALSRMVILGNSFKGTEERVLNKIFQKDYSYIAKVLPATDETDLPSHPQYLDIFNDTSVHCFPLEKLKHLPPEIWDFQEEPVYQDEDQLEIIRNKQ